MDWADIVDVEGRALSKAARQAPEAAVPSAPDWKATDLARHVAFLYGRVATTLRTGNLENPFRRDEGLAPPPKRDDALDALDANLAAVTAELRAVDPSQPVGTFTGAVETAAWWARRLTHETTVHRVDTQQASGAEVTPIEAALAVDGIDELLDLAGGTPAPTDAQASGPTAHLHATDIDGEWLLTLADDHQLLIARGHAKGDVALRGPAADLFLWLWGRATLDQLETFGDTDIADQLRERVRR